MYFSFGPREPFPEWTYLIAKNPASPPYERDLSGEDGARRVVGKYIQVGDMTAYELVVHNDQVRLVERLRAENRASYVSASPYSVNPRNLKCVVTALKSAVDGKCSELPEEVRRSPKHWGAHFGPLIGDEQLVREVFQKLGLACAETPRSLWETKGQIARTYQLETTEPISLREFLQKVVVALYALTAKQHDGRQFEDSLVESLVKMSEGWLARCEHRNFLVARLSQYKKGAIAKFEEAMTDEETPVEATDALEQREPRLHEKRHLTIKRLVEESHDDGPTHVLRIVDLGSGEGSLARMLAETCPAAQVMAVDASDRKMRWHQRIWRRQENIMHVVPEGDWQHPDALILSEVIEHLQREDREELVELVTKVWQPARLILTTPNVSYNQHFGIELGKYRHWDHRVEYDEEQLWSEVCHPLIQAGYKVEVLGVDGWEAPEGVEEVPSFVVVADATSPADVDKRLVYRIREATMPVTLEEVGYTVSTPEVREGTLSDAYRHHRRECFFLAPTMAPVDFDPRFSDFLEHPEAAFDYYQKRGVTQVVVQHKYMGSRLHLLLFGSHQASLRAGFGGRQMVDIARSGFPFFRGEEREAAWARIQSALKLTADEFVMLDCEAMPWSIKAGGERGLIAREFQGPGEAALLWAQLAGKDEQNARKFLETLSWFAGEGDVEIRPFGLLASGKVDERGRYVDRELGEGLSQQKQLAQICRMVGSGVSTPTSPFAWISSYTINTSSITDRRWTTEGWEKFTTVDHGEGFVVKPLDPRQLLKDGSPVQPALKVRGREYLRIIYGQDYLEPRVFDKLKVRNVAGKRRAALLEHALSRRILLTFLRGMHREHARLGAAFLGTEGRAAAETDRTL